MPQLGPCRNHHCMLIDDKSQVNDYLKAAVEAELSFQGLLLTNPLGLILRASFNKEQDEREFQQGAEGKSKR